MEHGAARPDRTADLTLGMLCRLSDRSECLLEWTVRFELTKTWVAARRLRPLGHVHGSTSWQRAPVPTRKPVGSKRLAGAAHPRWGYPLCLAESGGLDPRICAVASLSRRARILSGSLSGKWQRAGYSKPNRSRDRTVFKAVSGPARFTLLYVAPPAGFDPAASCLTNKRSPE